MEDDLTQERSIWGPMCADDDVVRWELDPTEGPCRMRKRMLPDPNFYRHYLAISRCVRAGSADAEGGAAKRRGFVAPQSLGARFCYRRRRLLRGPEHPKKSDGLSPVPVPAPPVAESPLTETPDEGLPFSEGEFISLPSIVLFFVALINFFF